MPFLAAGAIAIGGSVAVNKAFPTNGVPAVLGTIALVIVASSTAGTRVAPLVRAVGLLMVMASVMATVKTINKKKRK